MFLNTDLVNVHNNPVDNNLPVSRGLWGMRKVGEEWSARDILKSTYGGRVNSNLIFFREIPNTYLIWMFDCHQWPHTS